MARTADHHRSDPQRHSRGPCGNAGVRWRDTHFGPGQFRPRCGGGEQAAAVIENTILSCADDQCGATIWMRKTVNQDEKT